MISNMHNFVLPSHVLFRARLIKPNYGTLFNDTNHHGCNVRKAQNWLLIDLGEFCLCEGEIVPTFGKKKIVFDKYACESPFFMGWCEVVQIICLQELFSYPNECMFLFCVLCTCSCLAPPPRVAFPGSSLLQWFCHNQLQLPKHYAVSLTFTPIGRHWKIRENI